MENSIFDVDNTYSIFLPKEYLNYKYMLNCTSDYIDLTDTSYIGTNTNYNYIRVYTNREGFVVERSGYTGNYTTYTTTEVNVSNSFFARQDASNICITAFAFIFVVILIFNCVTEFISRGGLFKWT